MRKVKFCIALIIIVITIIKPINAEISIISETSPKLEETEIVYFNDFETDDYSDFISRGNATVSIVNNEHYSGNSSLLISNRTQTWSGAMISVSDKLETNTEYLISLKVKNPNTTNVSLSYKYNDEQNNTKYSKLANSVGEGWQAINDVKFTYTDNQKEVYLYFEGGTDDIYVDDFMITKATIQEDLESLKDVYENSFKIGVGVTAKDIKSKVAQELIKKHFNSVTLVNELKPDKTIDRELTIKQGDCNNPQINLDAARSILDFCKENDIPVRGHVVIWHEQTPEWFFKENFSEEGNYLGRDEMLIRMENYIKNLFGKLQEEYPTVDFYAYDIVNEVILDNGDFRSAGDIGELKNGLKCTPWRKIFGNEDYIEYAFKFARQYASEDTKLYYCDFKEYLPAKSTAIANMVSVLKNKGLADGVGLHAHLTPDDLTESEYEQFLQQYSDALALYSSFDLDIQITELDIGIDENKFEEQAKYYSDFVDIVLQYVDNVSALVFWNLTDDMSWKENANLFLPNYSAKPAFYALIDKKINTDHDILEGDINGDNKVTATDLLKIKRHIVRIEEISSEKIMYADMNKDAKVTATDLLIVKRKIVGLE